MKRKKKKTLFKEDKVSCDIFEKEKGKEKCKRVESINSQDVNNLSQTN